MIFYDSKELKMLSFMLALTVFILYTYIHRVPPRLETVKMTKHTKNAHKLSDETFQMRVDACSNGFYFM